MIACMSNQSAEMLTTLLELKANIHDRWGVPHTLVCMFSLQNTVKIYQRVQLRDISTLAVAVPVDITTMAWTNRGICAFG